MHVMRIARCFSSPSADSDEVMNSTRRNGEGNVFFEEPRNLLVRVPLTSEQSDRFNMRLEFGTRRLVWQFI